MSEDVAVYNITPTPLPLSKRQLLNRSSLRVFSDDRYRPPTPHEISSLFNLAGWTQNEAAILLGVSHSDKGSNTIRRWKTDEESPLHRSMPYAAWRLALILAGLVKPEG